LRSRYQRSVLKAQELRRHQPWKRGFRKLPIREALLPTSTVSASGPVLIQTSTISIIRGNGDSPIRGARLHSYSRQSPKANQSRAKCSLKTGIPLFGEPASSLLFPLDSSQVGPREVRSDRSALINKSSSSSFDRESAVNPLFGKSASSPPHPCGGGEVGVGGPAGHDSGLKHLGKVPPLRT
jgi:hypothetical protein